MCDLAQTLLPSYTGIKGFGGIHVSQQQGPRGACAAGTAAAAVGIGNFKPNKETSDFAMI